MKLTYLLTRSLPAIAGAILLQSTAQAQVPTAYSPDDLFLGFRTSGGTVDYLVNIGQASQYRDFGGVSFTLSLGNIQADLVANFGANWFNRSDLFWGISGTSGLAASGGDPSRTLYATRAEGTFGTLSPLWNRGSSTAQGTVAGRMNGLADAYLQIAGVPNMSTANSNFGLVQNVGDANSLASYMPGGTTANSGPSPGISFAYFNPTIEDSFANGTLTQLDLVRLTPGAGLGEFVGTFGIDSGANVTFFNNVPEPGSFVMLGAGAGVLGLLRRRRNA